MARIRYRVDPRDAPPEKVARRLHLSRPDFIAKLPELFSRGFPRPDPTTAMFDMVAVDAWMDARHQLTCRTDLTEGKAPRNAGDVFGDRARRLLDG